MVVNKKNPFAFKASRQEKRKAVENVWANLVPRKQIIS